MTEDQARRYAAAAHAVQTGVAYELEIDPKSGTPKHVRTGLNIEMCSHAALVRLLIAAGVFTEPQYVEAVIAELLAEKRRYEERLTRHYGGQTKITLG